MLCSNGELRWYGVDETEGTTGDSCTIMNAFISPLKSSLFEEIGDFNEDVAPFYIFIGTATRRITLRTDSNAERDRWIAHLSAVSSAARNKPSEVAAKTPIPQLKKILDDTEEIFANSPQRKISLFSHRPFRL